MKVLVCCKVVPDLEMLTEEDWIVRDMDVELRFAKKEWNTFDESALEMALRLRDSWDKAWAGGVTGEAVVETVNGADDGGGEGLGYVLTALTIGDAGADPFLKNLLALKFDHAARIEHGGDVRFSPAVVAELIARYIRESGQDVILMGNRSGPGDNGVTPLMTAELLGAPCITRVRDIRPASSASDRLIVESEVDDGILEQEINPPCVLSVGNAEKTYLRVPTLKDKMKYGSRPVEVSAEHPREQPEPTSSDGYRLKDLEYIDANREGILIEGGSPEEKARKVYELYLKTRMEKIWTAR